MESSNTNRWVLLATILGSSLTFIDATVVNVALPALQASLDANVTDVQWVIEGYALMLASLILVSGSLGDSYGRKRIFIIGVILFTITSLWCGLARDIQELIIARTFQGIGGALIVPSSLAILSSSFDDNERGKAKVADKKQFEKAVDLIGQFGAFIESFDENLDHLILELQDACVHK